MPDRELDISMFGPIDLDPDLEAAIDAANDEGRVTWLTRGGRRVAKIAPAGEVPESRLTASAFTALSAGERQAAVLDRFYGNLREPEQP